MSTSATSSDTTLVHIGTHSLALYIHGPEPASSKEPVVLFIPGVASSSLVWTAVVRLLSSLRSYTYDRSGFGKSEVSPLAPTAENIALELSLLVQKAPILNPLILVGHSWAGVLISEFIALTGNGPHIAGLVLVDANHETMPLVLNVNDSNLLAVAKGVDFYTGIGLAAEHKLTQEEWIAFNKDQSTKEYDAIAEKEDTEYAPSFETLRKKGLAKRQPLLQDKPVYVIGGLRSRDWTGLYKAGVEKGNGTEEQRNHVQEMIRTADAKTEGLMKEFQRLSTRSEVSMADKSGHFIQLTQPNLVVEGIHWVLSNSESSALVG